MLSVKWLTNGGGWESGRHGGTIASGCGCQAICPRAGQVLVEGEGQPLEARALRDARLPYPWRRSAQELLIIPRVNPSACSARIKSPA